MSSPGTYEEVARLTKEYEEARERRIKLEERNSDLEERNSFMRFGSGPRRGGEPIAEDPLQELRKAKEEEREALHRYINAMRQGTEGR